MIAKQLSLVLFVERHAMALQQGREIARYEACQRGAAEIRVIAKKVRCRAVLVGEVTAAAARNPDLFGYFLAVIEQQYREAALPGDTGAEQACRTSADDDYVKDLHDLSLGAAPCRLMTVGINSCGLGACQLP